MLRTQVLQSMDLKSWQLLAVTSPTPACGKTLTSINLALSIARQPERSVLLVDMDIEKPQVANYLGLKCETGLLSVLGGRVPLQNALVQASVGGYQLTVLPCESSAAHSSEYMASRAMSTLLHELKNEDRSRIIIFDMPPVLAGDSVISILPQIDCVLFVAAVGTTTASEIKECNKHFRLRPSFGSCSIKPLNLARCTIEQSPRTSSAPGGMNRLGIWSGQLSSLVPSGLCQNHSH